MTIDIQIKSLLFSLLFGAFFALLLRINYKYVYTGNIILRILINIFFVVDSVLLYFVILKKINNGIVHVYFLLAILLGFVTTELIAKRIWIALKLKK